MAHHCGQSRSAPHPLPAPPAALAAAAAAAFAHAVTRPRVNKGAGSDRKSVAHLWGHAFIIDAPQMRLMNCLSSDASARLRACSSATSSNHFPLCDHRNDERLADAIAVVALVDPKIVGQPSLQTRLAVPSQPVEIIADRMKSAFACADIDGLVRHVLAEPAQPFPL